MSFNRENVLWQNQDGTWNMGFYDCYEVNQDDEDHDPEWDVEYNFNKFDRVVINKPTQDAAYSAIGGPNPGGSDILEFSDASAGERAKYDKMAAECIQKDKEQEAQYRRTMQRMRW